MLTGCGQCKGDHAMTCPTDKRPDKRRVDVYVALVKTHGARKTIEFLLAGIDELRLQVSQYEKAVKGYRR